MENTEVKVKKVIADEQGLLASWVGLASGVAERGVGTLFGVSQDVRGEVNQRVIGVIDFVDGAQQGQIKLARTVNDRLDLFSSRTIEAAEQAILGLVTTARSAGQGAADLAARSAQQLTSKTNSPQVRKAA
jgi:hypothetical protein